MEKIRIPSDFDTFPAISVNDSRIPSIEHVPTKVLKPGPKTTLDTLKSINGQPWVGFDSHQG